MAVGLVGRQIDGYNKGFMRAEILAWTRSHGVFPGVSVNGLVVKKDRCEDLKFYGRPETNQAILRGIRSPL